LAISAFVRLEWKLNFEVSATAPPGKAAGRPAIIDEKSPDAFRHPGFRFVNHLGLSLTAGFDAPWRVHGGRGCESSDRDGNSMTKKVSTRNGLEALDLARQHRPDLILMDIQLPEVSGLEVTKWLKEDDDLHTIPVIAVTAFAMKGDEERIRQGGCEAYISKPISVPRFVETIKSYLGDA
jgi:two-component system cell cycle response regulator DivK